MIDQITSYRDPYLSLYQLNSNYTLLLQIYPATFSYAIVFEDKLQAWAKDCELLVLDDPGSEHELLNYEYKKVVAGLQSTGFTLVPNALYNENRIADFARFLDVKPNEKIFAQPLDADNHIIYKVDERVVETAAIYGLRKTVFINKGWINAIAGNNPSNETFYLNVDKEQVDILNFNNGKIRFYNSFSFANPDELVYYAALVAQQLQLQPKDINLVVSGDIEETDENASRLSEFFASVERNYLNVLHFPLEVTANQLPALAALSLCVSSEED